MNYFTSNKQSIICFSIYLHTSIFRLFSIESKQKLFVSWIEFERIVFWKMQKFIFFLSFCMSVCLSVSLSLCLSVSLSFFLFLSILGFNEDVQKAKSWRILEIFVIHLVFQKMLKQSNISSWFQRSRLPEMNLFRYNVKFKLFSSRWHHHVQKNTKHENTQFTPILRMTFFIGNSHFPSSDNELTSAFLFEA